MSCIPNPLRHSFVQNIMNLNEKSKNVLDWYHPPIRILERGNGINKNCSSMRNNLLHIKWHEQLHYASLKIIQNDPSSYWQDSKWSYLVMKEAGTQMLLDDWKKYWINLDTNILPAIGTAKSSALAWHHKLWDFMLGASCDLELLEMLPTKHRNPDDTDKGAQHAP